MNLKLDFVKLDCENPNKENLPIVKKPLIVFYKYDNYMWLYGFLEMINTFGDGFSFRKVGVQDNFDKAFNHYNFKEIFWAYIPFDVSNQICFPNEITKSDLESQIEKLENTNAELITLNLDLKSDISSLKEQNTCSKKRPMFLANEILKYTCNYMNKQNKELIDANVEQHNEIESLRIQNEQLYNQNKQLISSLDNLTDFLQSDESKRTIVMFEDMESE